MTHTSFLLQQLPCPSLHIVCHYLIIICNRMNRALAITILTPLPSAFLVFPPVRLRSNRLSLVEECIARCSTAYKQSTTLLNLASLLRVSGKVAHDQHGQTLPASSRLSLFFSSLSFILLKMHLRVIFNKPDHSGAGSMTRLMRLSEERPPT